MAATHFSGPVVSEAGFQTGGTAAAGGSTSGGIQLFGSGAGFFSGTGAPTFAAPKGSLYTNSTASTSATRLYINTDGSTTWSAYTSAA